MADGQAREYYWESTNENTTGENVGVVLDSLSDIVAENDVAPGIDMLKWFPGEEGEKGHFGLGEGGSVIPGQEDQLVSADGRGKAKPNRGQFLSIQETISNMSTPTLITPYPGTQIKFTGGTEESYWGNMHKGSLTMQWSPQLQFLGSNQFGSPVLSMRDKSIIDIDGGKSYHANGSRKYAGSDSPRYNPYMSTQAERYYNATDSPFVDSKSMISDNLVYPYFMMKESATVLLEGTSLVHISGGSSLFMDGNADVRISGAYVNGGNYFGRGRTYVNIDPGSVINFASLKPSSPVTFANNYSPAFIMEVGSSDLYGQIILTNQLPWQDAKISESEDSMDILASIWNCVKWSDMGICNVLGLADISAPFVRQKMFISSTNPSNLYSATSGIQQPTLAIQGKSWINIGDTGTFAANIQTANVTAIDWTSEGTVGIKMGSGSGAIGVYEIVPGAGTQTHVRFSPDPGTRTNIAFEPSGLYSLKVSPIETCGISFTPSNTDIVCQWQSFEGIFEGQSVYAQVEGNSHFEFLNDSTVIMRGPGTSGWDASKYNNGPTISIEGTTNIDCTGYTFEELYRILGNSQKAALNKALIPNFTSNGKNNVTGGAATSTITTANKYKNTISGIIWPNIGGSPSTSNRMFVYSTSTSFTSTTQLMNSEEFKGYIRVTYGPNAVVSGLSYQKRSSYGQYYYYIICSMTNVDYSFYSETQYPVGTTWDNIDSTDKTGAPNTYDFTNAEVSASGLRPDLTYKTSISGYSYTTGTHLGKDWINPIEAKTGPITQMYGLSNFCMRGNLFQYIFPITITSPTETYDFTKSQKELINDFVNGADYTTFKSTLETEIEERRYTDCHFDHIESIEAINEGIKITAIIAYKLLEHDDKSSPLVEIIGDTEVRIANGISIKTDNINGQSAIKIEAPEGEVSFTLAELQALKNLIINPPTPTPSAGDANTAMEIGRVGNEGVTGIVEEVEE